MKVFEKKASERMPRRKPWDHAIEMKPGYEPKKSQEHPTGHPRNRREVEEFLNNQLSKGYIQESKSPQTISSVSSFPRKT